MFNMLGEVSDELLHGWEVTVVGEQKEGRVFCKTDYGYAGYVNVCDITRGTYRPTHRVKSHFCDILPQPGYIHLPSDTLPKGAFLEVIEKGEKFCTVKYNGTEAFVPCAHLEPLVPQKRAKPSKIIRCAKEYMGVPYRWGGKTPLGIDCSGLCFMAYYLNGIKIYRDARFPFYSDYEIKKEELRPADLVFFKGHVAMYIGNGKIIHSNSADGMVTVSELNYKDVLACASLYELF